MFQIAHRTSTCAASYGVKVNPFNKTVNILEIQKGSILKETDIVRYQDVYGRV